MRVAGPVIGLTGGIGSGKSQVASMLTSLGAEVVDADQVSHDLMGRGSGLLARLVEAWGPDLLDSTGRLDRNVLASRVFGRPEEVARLNALTHPPILQEIALRLEASEAPVRVLMAPLLFEAGADRLVGEVWVVRAEPNLRVRRVVTRDAVSEEQARKRMAAQMSEDERSARAHVVLQNDGDLESLREQVSREWERLVAGRASNGGNPER